MELELGLLLLPRNIDEQQKQYSYSTVELDDLDVPLDQLNNNPTEVLMLNTSYNKKRDFSEAFNKRLVGWPPIKTTRKINFNVNNLGGGCCGNNNNDVRNNGNDTNINVTRRRRWNNKKLVKVKMDGVAIGRKVDVSLHNSYHSLLFALDHMFGSNPHVDEEEVDDNIGSFGEVKLDHFGCDVEGHRHCTVAYEDGEGDWMLVGDVPWETFAGSVKRLKITSIRNQKS